MDVYISEEYKEARYRERRARSKDAGGPATGGGHEAGQAKASTAKAKAAIASLVSQMEEILLGTFRLAIPDQISLRSLERPIYMYIFRERGREREGGFDQDACVWDMVNTDGSNAKYMLKLEVPYQRQKRGSTYASDDDEGPKWGQPNRIWVLIGSLKTYWGLRCRAPYSMCL
ncbi:uncharacterized protein LOC116253494 isoform X1 [Nymphaea colorata]|nr:uncharacterized protein LOC116253494 isoform X1 [Nymphaea colorata]